MEPSLALRSVRSTANTTSGANSATSSSGTVATEAEPVRTARQSPRRSKGSTGSVSDCTRTPLLCHYPCHSYAICANENTAEHASTNIVRSMGSSSETDIEAENENGSDIDTESPCAWNNLFQRLLTQNQSQSHNTLLKYQRLTELYNNFAEAAKVTSQLTSSLSYRCMVVSSYRSDTCRLDRRRLRPSS